jgi:flagellar hook-length control protein FliK
MLAGMIFGSAGHAKLNLQSATDAATGTGDPGKTGEDDPGKLMSSSLDSMLTMFEGPVNASQVLNFGSINTEKIPLDANELKAMIGAVDVSDQPENGLNTLGVSAKVISETIGGDGTLRMVAEINGKTVEFSGRIKSSEVSASMLVESYAETENTPESADMMTAMEIITMLQNNAEENSAIVSPVMEKSSSGDGMKAAAQLMSAPETYGIRQPGFDEARPQEFTGISKEKPENGADSIESSLKSVAYQSQVQNSARTDAPEATQLTQQTGAPEAYSQIREEILSKLEQKGPTEFKMQLEPEDLGQIDIKLKLSEGKLIIDIIAADARTQALLTSQVDKLVLSMGLQNVQVESVQVSQQMNSQTQDNSQSQGFTMNSAMDFSQKQQQEQSRREILNNGNPAGAFSQKQDETKTNDMKPIESIRFDNHRMNYSV